MFFPNVLKYLDEALDQVTGRYAEGEENETIARQDSGDEPADKDRAITFDGNGSIDVHETDTASSPTPRGEDAVRKGSKATPAGGKLDESPRTELGYQNHSKVRRRRTVDVPVVTVVQLTLDGGLHLR